ncbi:hypothetical protein B0H13DRAFT_2360764 [Mycena leptocephala]|nr:hypothetical protein B0H13DRAFT_2360764 [Mycena leptocephala]
MALETHYTVSSSRLPLAQIWSTIPPTSTPQPVVLHASASRAAHTPLSRPSTAGVYTPLFILAPTDMRSSAGTDMQILSLQAQGGIPLMLSERAYPGDDRCARSARAALRASPPSPAAADFPSLAARFPPSRAGALHASREVHSVMDTSTLFQFCCATQLSNASCAEFSAYRNLDGYLPSFIHPLTIRSSPFPPYFPARGPRTFCLFMIYPSFVPPSHPSRHRPSLSTTRFAPPFVILALVVLPPLSPLFLCARPPYFPSTTDCFFSTPTRRGPCSFREDQPSTTTNATSSSVTTTRVAISLLSYLISYIRTYFARPYFACPYTMGTSKS